MTVLAHGHFRLLCPVEDVVGAFQRVLAPNREWPQS